MEQVIDRVTILKEALREARRDAANHALVELERDVERLQAFLVELREQADLAREAANHAERARDAARLKVVEAQKAYADAVNWGASFDHRMRTAAEELRDAKEALAQAKAGLASTVD
jgi:chromosome segregation ATPase